MSLMDPNQAPMIFAPELEAEASLPKANWRILVVDDDEEVHKVTTLALNNRTILGRALTFEHAYSSREARQLLTEYEDFAVILLDVVMETESAGLDLVHYIRENLEMSAPRIILRTGQPGFAPEQEVIQNYDINDYRAKTEMTQGRLITSVTTAVRSYRQINLQEQCLHGLEQAIRKASALPDAEGIQRFAEYTLEQIQTLLGLDFEGLFVAQLNGVPSILHAAGEFKALKNVSALPESSKQMLVEALYIEGHRQKENCICLNVNNGPLPTAICLRMPKEVDRADVQLLQSYAKHLKVAYQNVILMQKLQHTAYVDDVTGLPNRARMIQMLDELTEQHAKNMCAALIDLEHFSDINGSLGQPFGDDTLRAVAEALQERFSSTSVRWSRVNADVFGAIGTEKEITPEKLLAVFDKPLEVNSNSIPLRVKIGLCRIAAYHQDGLGILHQCSLALKQAKQSKHLHHTWFEADYETRTRERLSIIRRLRQAYNQEQLEVWFQPQLNLESGKVEALEALIRWQDGDRFISPAVFIPLAEYSGLIVEIGRWVLEQSCQKQAELKRLGINCRVAVNVSMQQFRAEGFVEEVKATLHDYGVAPEQLELEITESVVMDEPEAVIRSLTELHALGIRVAIDDFGTGYSSLSYLKQLPLSTIKIDRAFVAEIDQPEASSIVEMVIGLASRLELSVVAEGIETPHQFNRLKEMGCSMGQGYLMARPMPFEQTQLFLQSPPDGIYPE